MIYTIGNKRVYDELFITNPGFKKLGKNDEQNIEPYEGGSVWKNYEEAKTNCPDNYEVYGVIADWDNDTEKGESCNYLLNSSEVIKL